MKKSSNSRGLITAIKIKIKVRNRDGSWLFWWSSIAGSNRWLQHCQNVICLSQLSWCRENGLPEPIFLLFSHFIITFLNKSWTRETPWKSFLLTPWLKVKTQSSYQAIFRAITTIAMTNTENSIRQFDPIDNFPSWAVQLFYLLMFPRIITSWNIISL